MDFTNFIYYSGVVGGYIEYILIILLIFCCIKFLKKK